MTVPVKDVVRFLLYLELADHIRIGILILLFNGIGQHLSLEEDICGERTGANVTSSASIRVDNQDMTVSLPVSVPRALGSGQRTDAQP